MTFVVVLWLMIWAGMFSGIYNLQGASFVASPLGIIQGTRALFPILAAYVGLISLLVNRNRSAIFGSPLKYFIFYFGFGIVSSSLLSPAPVTALYWAVAYFSPFVAIWIALDREDAKNVLFDLIKINEIIILLIFLILLPDVIKGGSFGLGRLQTYSLPFGFGKLTANGVGRYALLVTIIAFIRVLTEKKRYSLLWIGFIGPGLYALAKTQSRTALLGLAVVSILFIFLRGLDWRFLVIGPVISYVIWISGFQWRARGNIERLVNLSGRENTWERALEKLTQSPFFGWGFNSDRILLNSEHMHNSYLQAAMHAGIAGVALFLIALMSAWFFIFSTGLFQRIKTAPAGDKPFLIEAILILGFLTSRSFFESTGAFYGVDLLLMAPSIAYLWVWERQAHAEEVQVSAGSLVAGRL